MSSQAIRFWKDFAVASVARDYECAGDQGCLTSTLAKLTVQMSNTITPDNALPVNRINQSNGSNPKTRWGWEVMLKGPQYANASQTGKPSPEGSLFTHASFLKLIELLSCRESYTSLVSRP